MYDQPRYKPYQASGFFDDGTSARPLVAGTVPRARSPRAGQGSAEHFDTGKTAGKLAETLPFPVDRSVLERGQERYPDLLHALSRRAGRRPGHDRPARVQPASALSQR